MSVKRQPAKYESMRARLNANSKEFHLHDFNPEQPWTRFPCRIWTSCLNPQGYGRLNIRGRLRHQWGKNKGQRKIRCVAAHRLSLALHLGVPVWALRNVGHRCDNRPCIEPEHLVSWTQGRNMQDMIAKNRGKNQFSATYQPARLAA